MDTCQDKRCTGYDAAGRQERGGVDVYAPVDGRATGSMRMKAAGMAAPDAEQIARAAYPQDWATPEEDSAPNEPTDLPTGTAGVYTFYDVNTNPELWQIYPHVWDGKLTFNTPGGPASCSATVTNGKNIVTAAHCLYDTTATAIGLLRPPLATKARPTARFHGPDARF